MFYIAIETDKGKFKHKLVYIYVIPTKLSYILMFDPADQPNFVAAVVVVLLFIFFLIKF